MANTEVIRHESWNCVARRFFCERSASACQGVGRCRPGAAAFGVGGDFRRRCAHGRGADGGGWAADGSRLGLAFQRPRPRRPHRRQSTGQSFQAQQQAAPRVDADRRDGTDPCRAWRRALADRRSHRLGFRGVWHRAERGDDEPGAQRPRLAQAFRASPSPRTERVRPRCL